MQFTFCYAYLQNTHSVSLIKGVLILCLYIRGMSKESKVFNYTVIIYFDKLTIQQRIPDVVLRSMDNTVSLENMFGLVI